MCRAMHSMASPNRTLGGGRSAAGARVAEGQARLGSDGAHRAKTELQAEVGRHPTREKARCNAVVPFSAVLGLSQGNKQSAACCSGRNATMPAP